jgi:RNase P subunit RPR2
MAQKLIQFKHEDGKLIKTTYKGYIGICPKCGDEGVKSPRETTTRIRNDREVVQRFTCHSCNFSGTGDKFGLSREPVTPISIEVIEGVGTCPKCNAENVAFPNGSHKYYSFTKDEIVTYKYLKCYECGYRARVTMFRVKEE